MLYFSSSEATQHTHRFWITKAGNTQPPTHIPLKQPTLYISSSEAIQHIHRFWITKAGNTQPPTHILLKQPTLYISCSEPTLFLQHTPQILDYEGRKHTAPHIYRSSLCWHFFQRGYSHIHRFWITKAGNTHTYTAEAAYAVHFLQRGYSAHPQILDYEGRKHTAPHTLLLKQLYSSEATQHIHRFWITKAGNTQPPTHLLLKQPTLYISCSEATQETHSPPHIYC